MVLRFRIAWVIVAVSIAALDCGAIRAGPESDSGAVVLLLLGALPMANVLVVGFLIGQRRPMSRPFLLGFETFGAVASFLYAAFVCLSPDPERPLGWYLGATVEPMRRLVERNYPPFDHPIALICIAAMLGWPQLAFAVIGGFLSRRFKTTITRRW
jgi:hypothetical protein